MSSDKLTYVALGGAGEIGMNMYLYGFGPVGEQRFILVDVGVTFPDMDGTPGVDLIMADPGFIAERADRLEAIFITHAHEDHVGALGHLMGRLQAPVYARRFTAQIARHKLAEAGLDRHDVHVVEPWPEQVEVGPFKVGFLPVSHSIPEASALVIDTPQGRILHTGDFKLDPDPQVGEAFDADAFRAVGEAGVKALVCDSTNVFSPRPGRSEKDLVAPIRALMQEAQGLVVATTFASNIARLRTLAQAAHDTGRSVVVLGRAMNRMIENGFAAQVLPNFPPVVDVRDAEGIARQNLFMLATGSQGERRAATAQLAGGSYHGFSLKEGDTFLFSSKTIPGNEKSVARILNQMSEIGVRVIGEDDRYHVSGHANRPDLEEVHRLVTPEVVIPMHGEHRHLREHCDLAQAGGIASVLAPNGAIVDLSGTAQVIDHVPTGRVYLDGSELIGATDGVVRDRMRMAIRGHVVVSVMLEADGTPADGVWVEPVGLPPMGGEEGTLARALEDEVDAALATAKRKTLADDEAIEGLVAKVVKAEANDRIGKKPQVTVLISRFED